MDAICKMAQTRNPEHLDPEEFPNQFTFGHSCHTVDLKMTTQHMQDKGAKIITTDDADLNGVDDKEKDNTVLLETNEKTYIGNWWKWKIC